MQNQNRKIGILLVNLGTPSAPTPSAVRRYLAEFLWDPRVVSLPRALWWPILHGIVLRIRPKRSAKLYQKIWTSAGSPLLQYSQQLATSLQKQLTESSIVTLGMRYGQPSIEQALQTLRQHQIQRLLVLPLYPQFSATTTGSTFDKITQTLKAWNYLPEMRFIPHYFQEPEYISAIANSVQQHWQQNGKNDHLVLSFHGLPQHSIATGDPYRQHCESTAEQLTQQLGLTEENWSLAFQSRFGYAKWLEPACDITLKNLPLMGKKNISVICPGFAVDCLETLEEIALQNRATFLAAGGEKMHYIPALNDSQNHTTALTAIIHKHTQGWI